MNLVLITLRGQPFCTEEGAALRFPNCAYVIGQDRNKVMERPLRPFIDEYGIAKVWRVQDPAYFILYCPIFVVGLTFTYEYL